MGIRRLLMKLFDRTLPLKTRVLRHAIFLASLVVAVLLLGFIMYVAIPFVRFERSPYWEQIQPGTWVMIGITNYDSSPKARAILNLDLDPPTVEYAEVTGVRYRLNGLDLYKQVDVIARYPEHNMTSSRSLKMRTYDSPKVIVVGREENPKLHVVNEERLRAAHDRISPDARCASCE